MTARFMLDTDMFSYAVSGRYPNVRKRFQALKTPPVLSAISLAEIRYGACKRRSVKLDAMIGLFMDLVEVRSFTSAAAERYAAIRATLEARGQLIGDMDMLIAAAALAEGLTLVTNNTAHFSRIPGLLIENWVVRR